MFWIRLCLAVTILVAGAGVGHAADPLVALGERLRSNDLAAQLAALEDAAALGPLASALAPAAAQLLQSEDVAVKYEAALTLGRIGDAAAVAVPALRGLAKSSDVTLRHAAWTALRQMAPASKPAVADLDAALADGDSLVQIAATRAAVILDPENKAGRQRAISILAAALRNEQRVVRSEAADGLVEIGADAVPSLLNALPTLPPTDRRLVLNALRNLGPNAASAVPTLLTLLPKAEPDVAAAVAGTLSVVAPDDGKTTLALLDLMKHASPAVRAAAAAALAEFPKASRASVPALAAALADADVAVRRSAAEALERFGGDAESAVPALDRALEDANGGVTIRAAEALGRIGAPALPALTKRLDDPRYANLALQTIGQMGSAAKSAAPRLLEKIQTPGALSPRELCLALAAVEPDPQTAGPPLQKIAQDARNPARPAAIYALGRIGDRTALPMIARFAEDKDPLTQMASAWALVQLEPKHAEYVKIATPRLMQALEHSDSLIRRHAAMALGRLGPGAASAVPALTKRLQEDDDLAVRVASAFALANIGEASRAAIPQLLELLQGNDPLMKRTAIFSLARLGPIAAEAVPALRREALEGETFNRTLAAIAVLRIQQDRDARERFVPVLLTRLTREDPAAVAEIVTLLGEVGSGRDDVVEALQTLEKTDNAAVREAATAALAKLRGKK